MKINFFPQNYKPRYSLQETYKYISEFIYKLTNILNSEYTYVDPLIITNKNESQDAYMNNNRVVFFDNLNSDVISQLITEQSVYLSNVIFENDLSNIWTISSDINRDANLIDESIVSRNIHICSKLESNKIDLNFITNQISHYLKLICDLSEHKLIKEYKSNGLITTNFLTINVDKLVKKNETLDTFKIKNFIKNNKCVLVINSPKHDLFKQLSIVGDDFNNSAILFFYNPYIEKVLPLIKISLVPNEKTVKEQIENKLSLFLFEKNIKTLEHTSPMFNIKIYLSNLLLTNLEKYHFGEIVASTWDEQIIKYCKTYKIKLM